MRVHDVHDQPLQIVLRFRMQAGELDPIVPGCFQIDELPE